MKKVAIVINARIQSTRCPNKHIRDIGGTTLIDIAISNLTKLKNVHKKYLAAHDEVLKESIYGDIEILHREYDSVAPGNAHHSIMYRHMHNVDADYIINYNPCQPFLDVDKLQQVIDWFIAADVDSFITVKQERNFFWDKDLNPVNFKFGDRLSTTGGPYVYTATHSLVGYKKEYLLTNWELFPNTSTSPTPYVVDWTEEELIDVDTELDFKIVKEVYRNKNQHTVESWTKLQEYNTDQVIAIDFDGVIHKNLKGYYDGTVYDEPVEGALKAIKYLSSKYKIILYTFKGHPDRPIIDGKDGIQQTWEWLKKYGIDIHIEDIVWGKPNAKIYIDDKGYRFEDWNTTLQYLDENI